MRSSTLCVAAGLFTVILAPVASAIATMPSWDGNPNTTNQRWVFNDSNPTPASDSGGNSPYGSATASVVVSLPFGTGWQDPADESSGTVQSGVNEDGAWDIGPGPGDLSPNNPGSILAEVMVAPGGLGPGESYRVDFFVYSVAYRGTSEVPSFSLLGVSPIDLAMEQDTLASDPPGSWQELNWSGHVENLSGNSLSFKLTGAATGSIIDEMAIYTLYTVVPEPSCGILVLIGGLSLASRRRRNAGIRHD